MVRSYDLQELGRLKFLAVILLIQESSNTSYYLLFKVNPQIYVTWNMKGEVLADAPWLPVVTPELLGLHTLYISKF